MRANKFFNFLLNKQTTITASTIWITDYSLLAFRQFKVKEHLPIFQMIEQKNSINMDITQERFNELLKTEARVIDLEIENKRLERYIELYKERAAMASEMTIKEEKEDELITLKEAAEWLGVSLVSLWKYEKEGRISTISIGARHKKISRSELRRFVAANTKTNA